MLFFYYWQDDFIKLLGLLKEVEFSKSAGFSVLRLFFIKYCIDNTIGADTPEKKQVYEKAKKMLAKEILAPDDHEESHEIIRNMFLIVDEEYGLSNILSSEENINEYERILYGSGNEKTKKGAGSDQYRAIRNEVSKINLKDNSTYQAGTRCVEQAASLMEERSVKNQATAGYTSTKEISEIAKGILCVKREEKYLDFVAGSGMSTLEITKEQKPFVINIDIESYYAATAAMLYIMCGYKRMNILVENSLAKQIDGVSGDKIFVDPPIKEVILGSEHDGIYKDTTSAAIGRTLNGYLCPGGKAVLTVPSSFLFSTNKNYIAVKEEMLGKKSLAAVISLPSLWHGTSAGTNMIVLANDKSYEDALLFDARNTGEQDNISKVGRSLKKEKRDEIIKVVNERVEIVGISKLVSYDDIKNNNCNLMPTQYISMKNETSKIALKEISTLLEGLYKELGIDVKIPEWKA